MKIEQKSAQVQSTMGGENVQMAIRPEDMAHIMGVLDGLYKDRLLAVLREYSTNAWDAHVEAGFSGAVEVTLPSSFHPYLKVRDYGEGLDRQGIREVYSQYGRSTKRASNEVTGMLGLGSKSALAYNSRQFTVTSIKSGVKLVVLVSKDEEGMGVMSILGEQPTDEASGTEITVGIARADLDRASILADDLFAYWTPGSVTVNGRAPAHFAENALKLSDDLYLVEGLGQDRLVMGNVPYPASFSIEARARAGYGRDFSLVYIAPIGSVMPTPSREALKDVKLTTDTLAKVPALYTAGISRAVQAQIDAAPTPPDALLVLSKWEDYVPDASALLYRGTPLPGPYVPTTPAPAAALPALPAHLRHRRVVEINRIDPCSRKSAIHYTGKIMPTNWPTTVWVASFEPTKFSADHHNKLVKWCTDNGIGTTGAKVARFVLCRGVAPDSKFIDPARVVDWSVVKKIKLDTKPRITLGRSNHIAGSFPCHTEDGYDPMVPGDKLRTNLPIFYLAGDARHAAGAYANVLAHAHKRFTLVSLSRNRVAKFCREVRQAIEATQAAGALFKASTKALTDDQRRALYVQDRLANLHYLDVLADAADPALVELSRLAGLDVSALRVQMGNYTRLNYGAAEWASSVPRPGDAYPLLRAADRSLSGAHIIAYVDAVYAARQNGDKI